MIAGRLAAARGDACAQSGHGRRGRVARGRVGLAVRRCVRAERDNGHRGFRSQHPAPGVASRVPGDMRRGRARSTSSHALSATEVRSSPTGHQCPLTFAGRRPRSRRLRRRSLTSREPRIRMRGATGAIALGWIGASTAVPAALRAARRGPCVLRASAHRDQPASTCCASRCNFAYGPIRLDAHTRMNLELFTRLGGTGTSLLKLLDATRTPMGVRLAARKRLHEPAHRRGARSRDGSTPIDALLSARDIRRRLRDALSWCARPRALWSPAACRASRRRATSARSAIPALRSTPPVPSFAT